MKKRITNYSSNENKLVNWRVNTPRILKKEKFENDPFLKDHQKNELQLILEQLYLLIETYPEALNDETIIENYKKLKQYTEKRKLALANCYSYSNLITRKPNIPGDIKYTSYGIRITPDDWNKTDKYINITGYDTTSSGIMLNKRELNLRLDSKKISYINMTQMDSTFTFILSKEILTYLNPNLHIKQKIK